MNAFVFTMSFGCVISGLILLWLYTKPGKKWLKNM